MLKPGELNTLIAFETRGETIDADGNAAQGPWTEHCRRFVKWDEDFARRKVSEGHRHEFNQVVLRTWQDLGINSVKIDMRARAITGFNKDKIGSVIAVQHETNHEIALTIQIGVAE